MNAQTQKEIDKETARELLNQRVKRYEELYRTKGRRAANDYLDEFKGSYAAEIRHQAFQ